MKNLTLMSILICLVSISTLAQCPSSCAGTISATFNGVSAKQNCPIGGDCTNFGYNSEAGINTGLKWQCVEYVNRYYKLVYGMDLKSTSIYGHAANYWNWTNHSTIGLTKYSNGGSTPPQIGDMIVSTANTYGHIAIVKNVTATTVEIIDQNFSSTSVRQLTRSGNNVGSFGTVYTVSGWIRKSSTTTNCVSPTTTQISATNVANTTAKLNCTVSGVAEYDWQYRKQGTSTWTGVTATTANNTTISGLLSGTTYEFQVAVKCGTAYSNWSSTKTFSTLSSCNAPTTTQISATNIATTSAKLNCTVTGVAEYDWQYRKQGTTTWTGVTATATNNKTITGLLSNTNYEFQAAVKCGTTYSNWSSAKVFKTL